MTLRAMTRPDLVAFACFACFTTLGAGACVLPDVGVGAQCGAQADCTSDTVCVRIDPEEDGDDNVCLPMLELDAPQACVDDEDCPAAGFPIDSFCDEDRRCTCDDEAFECGDFEQVVGEHTCRCLDKVLDIGGDCEDDNQCISGHCGDGVCTEGLDGDGCDTDDDCPFSIALACLDGTCG